MCYAINGNWKAGWALDLHTLGSSKTDNGFANEYSDIGYALNQLKYHEDYSKVNFLAKCVEEFLKTRLVTRYIDVIIATPPSNMNRKLQPVYEIAKKVSESMGIKFDTNYLIKTKNTSQLKNIDCVYERQDMLNGAFSVEDNRYDNKKVLLFDDLFRSGSTLNEITKTLYKDGNVQNVYVVTLTKTRANGLAKR